MFLESSPDLQRRKFSFRCSVRVRLTAFLSILALFLTGCAGLSSSTIRPSALSNARISLLPDSVTLDSGATQQFAATITSTSNTGVIWRASAGTISSSGSFTAPTVESATDVNVTATSAADESIVARGLITVIPTKKLAVSVPSLAIGTAGIAYTASLAATGGSAPYQWQIVGALPRGLSLNPSRGVISGTTSQAGIYSFRASVTDANSATASKALNLAISAAAETGNFDGPAELPRVTVQSKMTDTPAPWSTISVTSGDNLQQALDKAQCGDTIELQAGATFAGPFLLPAKPCDANHWIILRTSAPDSALPPEGQRMNPCYAGVASLPGRPQYGCPSTHNVLARVELTHYGDGVLQLADGANHYRILGLEITRPAGVPGSARLVYAKNTADHIIVDRCWLHGAPQDETHNGVDLDGTTYVAVVDSYLNDFHCIARTGICTDAHAVAGGLGDNQGGPYKIENNYLEASGESVMFGGGAATTTPADIEIRHNHFFKPWQWMRGQSGFVGGPNGNPFIVKNHLELKNATRVLVENNLLENSWGGFSQGGFAILLTPKNQFTRRGTNVCPICQVTDITIRYTHISHAGAGLQLATSLSDHAKDATGKGALAGARWSLHDLVIDDLNPKYIGGGTVFEIMNNWPQSPLHDLSINHVTAFPYSESHLMVLGNLDRNEPMYGFEFTNNLVTTGKAPVWNAGGGVTSCAYHDVPVTSVANCFTTYSFKNNGLVASPAQYPPSSWPGGNMFPDSPQAAGIVNFSDAAGGDYALQPNSPYKNKGTDGKDLGADIAGLNAALADVE